MISVLSVLGAFVFGFRQTPMSSMVNTLQKADTLTVKCVVRAADGPPQLQEIHLMKPNLFRIKANGRIVTASGAEITTAAEDGRIVSKVAQTPASLKAVLADPSLRLWLGFFDQDAYKQCTIEVQPPQLLFGVTYDLVRTTWTEEPPGGFEVLLDTRTRLPKQANILLPGGASRLEILSIQSNAKLSPTEFGAKKVETGGAVSVDAPEFLMDWEGWMKSTVHPMIAGAKYRFSGHLESLVSDQVQGRPVKVILAVNGATHAEDGFSDNWNLTWDTKTLAAGTYKVTLIAKYVDTSFTDRTKEVGSFTADLMRALPLQIQTVEQKTDGSFSIHLKEPAPVLGKLTLSIRSATSGIVPLAQDMVARMDGVVPGINTIEGVVSATTGIRYPIEQQRVYIKPACDVKFDLDTHTVVTLDNEKKPITIHTGLESSNEISGVEVVNDTFPVGDASFKGQEISIGKEVLFEGHNDIVLWIRLASGARFATEPKTLQAHFDIKVQQARCADLLYKLLHEDISIGIDAFAHASGYSKEARKLDEKFPEGQRIPRPNDWKNASSWIPADLPWTSSDLPITTDEAFNDKLVEVFSSAVDTLRWLHKASLEMSFARGESGLIKLSSPSALYDDLQELVRAIDDADDSVQKSLKHLEILQTFVTKYRGRSTSSFADEVKLLTECSQIWHDKLYHVGFLRTLGKIVEGFPDEAALTRILDAMPQGDTSGWEPKTRDAINDLVSVIQHYANLQKLRAKVVILTDAVPKTKDKRNLDLLTKEILQTNAEIDLEINQIMQGQKDAWELLRREGVRLGFIMDGLYDAAPKLNP